MRPKPLRDSSRAFYYRVLLVLCVSLVPGAALAWLLDHPRQNPSLVVPTQHFIIVSIVSVLALSIATVVTVAALHIQQYRVLFLALGFMSMGGLFAVHAAATPGFILDADAPAANSPATGG